MVRCGYIKTYIKIVTGALFARKNKRPAGVEPAGRPVDCLGLTKRWSLYVASHTNSRVGPKPKDEGLRATDAMPPSVITG